MKLLAYVHQRQYQQSQQKQQERRSISFATEARLVCVEAKTPLRHSYSLRCQAVHAQPGQAYQPELTIP